MLTTKLDWIETIDIVVMYAFNMAVENDFDEVDSEDMDILIEGASDKTRTMYEKLSHTQKVKAQTRTNSLIKTYQLGKKNAKCDICGAERTATLRVFTEGEYHNFDLCEKHMKEHMKSPHEKTQEIIEIIKSKKQKQVS